MKNSLMPLALFIGLAGVASSAQAVYVNPKGLGEVLLYPFYTVENGQDTYVAIANTTDTVKAVKVRLHESMNSATVIQFNLYLSPHDHWTGVITRDPNGVGGLLKTADTSCTVPTISAAGVKLNNLLFSGDHADGGPQGLERTREGYIEVIEMGTIDDSVSDAFGVESAATHVDGTPADCAFLRAAWQEQPLGSGNVVGEWSTPTANFWPFDPALTGGLYGYAVLINTQEGTNATYDAVALDAFADKILHTRPGAATPTLADAAPIAKIIDENRFISLDFTSMPHGGLDAVSAVLMQSYITNDYVLEPSIAASTDWVITLPTKRDYVNLPVARAPFLNHWEAPGVACDDTMMRYWNREQGEAGTDPESFPDIDFPTSPIPPPPPSFDVVGVSLCGTANVISFISRGNENLEHSSSPLYPSERTRIPFTLGYYDDTGAPSPTVFHNGRARLLLNDNPNWINVVLTASGGEELYGLPVIGFAVQKYANSSLTGASNAGAFYSGVINHKATTDLVLP